MPAANNNIRCRSADRKVEYETMKYPENEIVGDMFDPGDWTEEELRKRFPVRADEFIEIRRHRILSDPEYYHATPAEIAELIQHVSYEPEQMGYDK